MMSKRLAHKMVPQYRDNMWMGGAVTHLVDVTIQAVMISAFVVVLGVAIAGRRA